MYIFCLACPKLFWTVNDETWYKGLSSNEFLRWRIRKKSSFFSFFFKLISSFSFFSNVYSLSRPFFEWVHWQLGGPPNYPGEYVVFFRLFFAENDSIVLNKVSILKVK